MKHAFFFAFALSLIACDSSEPLDAGASDAGGGLDAAVADAGGPADAGATDAGADAGSTDAGATDAGSTDAGATDAGSTDAGSTDAGTDSGLTCSYLDLDIWIADCGSGYLYVRRWIDTDGVCPEYFTVGPTRYDTLADALAMSSCDPDCLRAASTSVSLIRCGRRTGYITFRDPDMDCPDLLETPDGLFESREAWDAAHPCP